MPINGRVIPHTPLAVDFWHVRKCPATRLFFLSHMHSDHTMGLTSTWSDRPIYCSPLTATLLKLKLQVKEQWIHPLEVGEPHLLPLDEIGKERLTVTLMDANHCPGSVMFLFQGYFGSILYTGDFRYTPSMLREHCLTTNATIDVLYLDNTNCDPNRSLPSRQQATQQIKEIIRSHPDHNVVIGVYALGKESLLVELAMEFKTWIEVSFERMETLKVLGLPDVFTTDPGAGRIRAVEQTEICSRTMNEWNKEQHTLAILPTSRPLVSFHPKIHVVPYSDHSSFQELEDFVTALQPTSLLPIVGNLISGSLSSLLPNKKRHEILVPESVKHYMLKQPESQSASSCIGVRHRHVRPLRSSPKGVVFDSPVSSTTMAWEYVFDVECGEQEVSGDEADTESSAQGSDCMLIDFSKTNNPSYHRRRVVNPCGFNLVQTVSEEMLMPESVPFSQLSQSNFAPVQLLENTRACLRPVEKTIDEMGAGDKNSEHGQFSVIKKNPTFSESDSMSQCGGHGIDLDADMSVDDSTQRHDQHEKSIVTLLHMNPDGNFSVSSSSSDILHKHIEKIENSILSHLPFEKEDFQMCRLLDNRMKFSTCPLNDDDEEL